MLRLVLVIFFVYSFFTLFAQVNMQELSKMEFSGRGILNDVWGYEDELGGEYVIVGFKKGTAIIDISNPSLPQEVFWSPGNLSSWRDMKVYKDVVYIINEGSGGIKMIDLSPLPLQSQQSQLPVTYYAGDTYPIQRGHNLFVDENGVLYVFGADKSQGGPIYRNGGVILLDVSNPLQPQELGMFDNTYLHDGFARGDTLWAAATDDGVFTVLDVSDKQNIQQIQSHPTPYSFTHNIWLSEDGKTAFTTDERSGAYIASYDVSDMSNIQEIDKIRVGINGVIPHNTHVHGDFIVTSSYTYGVVIHDITQPDYLVEVGSYDTSPNYAADEFAGCWGVYPWYSSGVIAATDSEEGLYILNADYKKAAFIEGLITDFTTGQFLGGVKVEFLNEGETISALNGTYKFGDLMTVSFVDIVFSKAGYKSDTVLQVPVVDGLVKVLDHQMKKISGTAIFEQLDETVIFTKGHGSFLSENPFSIQQSAVGYVYYFYDSKGQLLQKGRLSRELNLKQQFVKSGVYWLKIYNDAAREMLVKKLIKL